MTVLGRHGYLGSVVTRRWLERGAASDYIVNCIRPDDLYLSRVLAHGRLIQPSSDAIAEDTDYARVKRELEQLPAVTIRAGIVDIRQHYPVAYHNWTCNPLTPLEWADVAWELRDEPGVHVVGREPLSRYGVAALVAEVFDLPAPVGQYATEPLDRTQSSERTFPPLRDALIEFRDWLF